MQSVHSGAYRAFRKRLLEARERSGLTQEQVAAALRIPQSRVSRMESGERRVDVVELLAFAQLYRRRIGWFLTRK